MTRAHRLAPTGVVRGAGWVLIVASMLGLLAVVGTLLLSGLANGLAQRMLALEWERAGDRSGLPGEVTAEMPVVGREHPDPSSVPTPASPAHERRDGADDDEDEGASGRPFAALWFERDGRRLLHDRALYVVEGVEDAQLRLGPGRYPATGAPGQPGNVAIAGHRTTYGAPFGSIDRLRHGDTIHLLDAGGTEWVYGYVRQVVVEPHDTWVIGPDPLGTAVPTLTLTTCHPRHSDAQRLVVFAELLRAAGEPPSAHSRAEPPR